MYNYTYTYIYIYIYMLTHSYPHKTNLKALRRQHLDVVNDWLLTFIRDRYIYVYIYIYIYMYRDIDR